VSEKPQTPFQRVTNPVWLRDQIQQLIKYCDEAVEEDLERHRQTRGDASQQYRMRAAITRQWKTHLERVLRGKTLGEEIAEALVRARSQP
jgi:hypothetical protein